jgi:hypothetical protein
MSITDFKRRFEQDIKSLSLNIPLYDDNGNKLYNIDYSSTYLSKFN